MNGTFKTNYEFMAHCLENSLEVDISGPDPKNFVMYTVRLRVGPKEYVETSRNPFTAMAYCLESIAKQLKAEIPKTLTP